MGYRNHLSRIRLSNNDSSNFKAHAGDIETTKRIMGLLSAQKRGGTGLDCLVIDGGYMLKLVKLAAEGSAGCRVKELKLRRRGPSRLDGEDIWIILMEQRIRGIEEMCLDIYNSDLQDLFTALGQGACPELLRFCAKDPDY